MQLDEGVVFSLSDHLGRLAGPLEWLVVLIELFAIAILILGVVRFLGWFLSGEVLRRAAHDPGHQLNRGRLALGRHILSALEVLIVADLIRTVLHLTFDNILLLGGLVLIRSFISVSLDYEMRALETE
ncbi:DUF1622 domain-containing protein (plasmid) [Paracoccus liaowanqingii]|uniref:DUF1622 domain-containing protein n=1 Tax=Paracoccus liaowanqingii TaxID=2560053 RepID=A0A4Y5SUQ1_9RHOB|nr:DUF1622 domain-containing protein [Paracoccus liaowanqingii]QDA36683.1 DUF1622 domain-containing protein [Paracoccus liaowanqingii]